MLNARALLPYLASQSPQARRHLHRNTTSIIDYDDCITKKWQQASPCTAQEAKQNTKPDFERWVRTKYQKERLIIASCNRPAIILDHMYCLFGAKALHYFDAILGYGGSGCTFLPMAMHRPSNEELMLVDRTAPYLNHDGKAMTYALILQLTQVAPESVTVLDDNIRHIEAAKMLGMQTHPAALCASDSLFTQLLEEGPQLLEKAGAPDSRPKIR